MEHPAEMPAEFGTGGSGGGWKIPPGGIGGPAEMPAPDWARISVSHLVTEIFRLRDRVHSLESNLLASKMRATGRSFIGGGIGGPNEMPEGEGGGGGGWPGGRGPFPPEISEIAEMPISRFITELSNLIARFTKFETQITKQIGAISQRLDSTKSK